MGERGEKAGVVITTRKEEVLKWIRDTHGGVSEEEIESLGQEGDLEFAHELAREGAVVLIDGYWKAA